MIRLLLSMRLAGCVLPLASASPMNLIDHYWQNRNGNTFIAYDDNSNIIDNPAHGHSDSTLIIIIGVTIGCFLLLLIILLALILRRIVLNRAPLQLSNNTPGSFADEQEEEENILTLPLEERQLYKQAKLYLQFNRPELATDLTLSQYLTIEEKGLCAWDFIPDQNLPPGIITVENKTEISFHNQNNNFNINYPCSIQSNLPIPRTNDVYYFEAKIYNLPFPNDTQMSIGLATKPYPFFRLPGRHQFSVAYDNDGSRRFNNSFSLNEKESKIFPRLEKGDVIGVGYRTRSGTIFFTRNGKKLSERKVGGHIKNLTCLLYPTIGASKNCDIHINIGQLGYVFIEANVKKWGFASVDGTLPPPPPYNQVSDDVLLESGSEMDDDDYYNRENDEFFSFDSNNTNNVFGRQTSNGLASPSASTAFYGDDNENNNGSIPNFPPPFWASNVSIVDNITLNTLGSVLPPVYTSDNERSDSNEHRHRHVDGAMQHEEVASDNEIINNDDDDNYYASDDEAEEADLTGSSAQLTLTSPTVTATTANVVDTVVEDRDEGNDIQDLQSPAEQAQKLRDNDNDNNNDNNDNNNVDVNFNHMKGKEKKEVYQHDEDDEVDDVSSQHNHGKQKLDNSSL